MKAEVFKAKAQPTRLRILELLHVGEMQARQIAAQVGAEAPTVSKHLTLLRKQALIAERKEGSKVFYQGTIPHLIGFMWCVENAVRQRRDAQMNPKSDSS